MANTPDDLVVAEQIDEVCDRFERDFRGGKAPRIEALLAAVADSQRPALLRALLGLELELFAKAGRTPDPQHYHERFPEETGLVDEAYASIRQAAPTSGKPTSPKSSESIRSSMASVDTSQGGRQRATSSLETLKKLGRFEIRQELGRGAFGMVYLAYDPQLDREVAIKVPQEKALVSDDDRRRFLREARSAASLQHPNICPVHEVGTIDGRDYIVMAFIDGKPLSKVLESGATLSERQVASAIRKIALALQEAHEKGIIHRDLKSANIMINRKGEPVVMDFGLARRNTPTEAQISVSGQIMGSPAYMSPEQARGESKSVGPQADVYSLGVLMYEMLCGRRPFLGNVTEVLGQILHVEPDPPSKHRPGLDANAEAVCLRAIAKDPKQRFATMTQFAAALSDCLKKPSVPGSRTRESSDAPPKTGSLTTSATSSIAATEPNESPVAETDHAQIGETQRLARIVQAVSDNVESKMERAAKNAVEQAAKRHGPKWWHYAIGSAAMGLILLCGILFFVRSGPATIIIQVPLPPGIDLKDTTLAFFLDNKAIAADELEKPIELKPGDHELLIRRGELELQRMTFSVGLKGREVAVLVKEVTGAPEQPPRKPTQDGGFVPLFNGRDLTGWKTHPTQPGGWTVEDGLLTGRSNTAHHLFSERGDFENFHFRAECRTNKFGNSGIYFRGAFALDRPGKLLGHPNAYEAQILHEFPRADVGLTGTLRSAGKYLTSVTQQLGKADEWITLEIIAQGKRLVVKVNGVETANVEDATYSTGHLVLQARTDNATNVNTLVQFRKVEVKRLPVPSTVAADEIGFVPLFNGKDLTGWKTIGKGDWWSVAEGELHAVAGGDGAAGALLYEREWGDYELQLEYRLPPKGNSGVFLRVPRDPANPLLTPYLEVSLLDDSAWPNQEKMPYTGSVYTLARRDKTVAVPPDQWHRLTVRCAERRVAVRVNDVEVLNVNLDDFTDQAEKFPGVMAKSGCIALQKHNSAVSFRNIRLKELTAAKPTEQPKAFRRLEGNHTNAVNAIAFSPDGRFAVSGDHSGWIVHWDLAQGKEIAGARVTPGCLIASIVYTPDGNKVLIGGKESPVLWNLAGMKQVRAFYGHTQLTEGVALSADGSKAATAGDDQTARVWDVASGQSLQTFEGHTKRVYAVALSPEGRYLLSGSFDQTIRLWDVQTGKEIRQINTEKQPGAQRAIFLKDGRHVLTGGWHTGVMRLWDVEAAKEVRQYVGHQLEIIDLSLSQDESRALTASSDGTIRLWDVATRRELHRIGGKELTDGLRCIALSPDGRFALSGHRDWSVRLWQLPEPKSITPPQAAVDPDRRAAEWVIRVGGMVTNLDGRAQEINKIENLPTRPFKIHGINLSNCRGVNDAELSNLKGLTDLRELWLNETALDGPGLENLKGMTRLEVLELEQTRVGDSGLQHLQGLTGLRHLDLGAASVTDRGLEYLKGLENLKALGLGGNHITDEGMRSLSEVQSLEFLGLEHTRVTDAGLKHLQKLTKLNELSLWGTNITKSGLRELAPIKSLTNLSLEGTAITDADLAELQAFKNLTILNLRGVRAVSDEGLKHLELLKGLKRLRADGTKATQAGLRKLKEALPDLDIEGLSPKPD